jgi:hypothetical protein
MRIGCGLIEGPWAPGAQALRRGCGRCGRTVRYSYTLLSWSQERRAGLRVV